MQVNCGGMASFLIHTKRFKFSNDRTVLKSRRKIIITLLFCISRLEIRYMKRPRELYNRISNRSKMCLALNRISYSLSTKLKEKMRLQINFILNTEMIALSANQLIKI